MSITIRTLDVVVVAVYLLAMLAIGAYWSRRSESADNYFAGKRNYPGWVVALSMLGTIISSNAFLALPAAAYVLDWRQLTVNLVVPFVTIIAVMVFIPFFRRGGLTSAFEYLGDRFGQGARIYGTLTFAFLQLVRVAKVLFLVALPMEFLTGAPIEWVIVGCGAFVALYSVAGGMEAVVWAGVLQSLIMLGGCVLCLGYVALQLPGGFAQVVEVGQAHNKFSLGPMDWNLDHRTFWSVAILGILNWLHVYSSEQTVVQRYVSARSMGAARSATLLFAGMAVPMWTTFFFIGTALFVFFRIFPDPAVAKLEPDQVLPYFVLTHIPAGLGGFVVAAVIAAAMSSLDSGVNSVATVVVIDLLKPHLAKGRSDRFYLNAARFVAGVSIVIMTLGAFTFAWLEKESMNDVSLVVFSVLSGAITGLYMLGFFTRRVDGFAVNIALVATIVLNLYLGLGVVGALPAAWKVGIHGYWVGAVVNLVFMGLAYGISLFRRRTPRDLTGLTVWTMPRHPEVAAGAVGASPGPSTAPTSGP